MKKRSTFRTVLVSLTIILGTASISLAQMSANFQAANSTVSVAAEAKKDFSHIKIENFGQMDERYYRGAQPNPGDYKTLKELGVNTVVDLRNDPTDYEKREAEALGMKYVNIPMSGWKTPKMASINEFLALMDDPSTGVVYVHCKAGRHRASVMGAAYRYIKYGWDYDKVYKEMKAFKYSNGLVHHALGDFVEAWGERLQDERESAARTAARSGDTATATATAGTGN
jgi:protein tyrosine/serine phosphatase